MRWFTRKNDATTIFAFALIFLSVTLANVWSELGFLAMVPSLVIAPLGLLPAWFLWAWTMLAKGYLPSLSPAMALASGTVLGPSLVWAVYRLARLEIAPDPKILIFVFLLLLFGAAFLLPSRNTAE